MREPVEIHARKKLTKAVLLSWAIRFMHCAICGDRLSNGFEDDHIIPVALGGSNDVLNRQPLCSGCHSIKTKDDIQRIAKAKRQGGETGQYARRKKNGSKMQSRPFDKRYRKKMNGEVERVNP